MQAIVAMSRGRLIGEASLVQNRIQEFSRRVAGKGPTGAIGSVSARSQAHDKDARIAIAETGNGLSPVIPVTIGAALFPGHLLAMGDQARTLRARDDVAV